MAKDWRSAYLAQAKSDYSIFSMLKDQSRPLCHQLHYLQMATEKLAKGLLTRPGGDRYRSVHDAFVKFVRVARGHPDFVKASGFASQKQHFAYLSGLLEKAQLIEDLSPEGGDHPNPEYPWQIGDIIETPCEYVFPLLSLTDDQIAVVYRDMHQHGLVNP